MSTQSAQSHAKWDPLYHFFLGPIFLLNVVFAFWWHLKHVHDHRHTGPWIVVVSAGLLVAVIKIRTYAVANQDRIIRLEEKARLATLATPSELAEFDSLTLDQYIGLRFASNPELIELSRRAVRENLTRKQIKAAIKSWRPDNHRI